MFTFNISFAVLLSVALLLSELNLQVEADECNMNLDCGSNKYCCKQRFRFQTRVCRSSCVGQLCSSDSDCGGPGECCSSSKYCTTSTCDECFYNSACGSNEYCCTQRYYNQTNICSSGGCVGHPCQWDSDCGGPGECCSSSNYCTKLGCTKCSSNSDCDATNNYYCCNQMYPYQSPVCVSGGCVDEPCNSNSDCGGPGECCSSSNNCKSDCLKDVTKGLASWIIVVSVLVALVIPIAIVVCLYRGMTSALRGRSQQGLGLNQPTGSTVVALRNTQNVQNNPSQFQNFFYAPPPYFEDQHVASQEPLSQDVPPAYTEYRIVNE